jgi:hypothetical protein
MLVLAHIYTLPLEANAFSAKAKSLFLRKLALESDFSTGPDNTLPRQSGNGLFPQKPRYGTVK